MLNPHDHAATVAVTGVLSLTGMWLWMMTAMMAPVAWPWVRAFGRFGADARVSSARLLASTLSFSSGYIVAWLVYSVVAALFQYSLARSGALDARHPWSSLVSGAILVGAGAFQFAPFKRACLTHCRNPITFFLARWRNGPGAGFRLGLGHGLYCVGCCWAIMATALVVGMTNLWWMVALTAAVFVEQVVPRGELIRAPLGVALTSAGVLFWVV